MDWWVDYVQWATDGSPPALLAQAAAWCAAEAPDTDWLPSLCWGDARIGNVLYSDDFEIRAVLDWELASIGPPEMDLGWYLVLDELVELFTGRTVPGFMPRQDVISCYERALGRQAVDVAWHELFALTRSVAVSERLARTAALGGADLPGHKRWRQPHPVGARSPHRFVRGRGSRLTRSLVGSAAVAAIPEGVGLPGMASPGSGGHSRRRCGRG